MKMFIEAGWPESRYDSCFFVQEYTEKHKASKTGKVIYVSDAEYKFICSYLTSFDEFMEYMDDLFKRAQRPT